MSVPSVASGRRYGISSLATRLRRRTSIRSIPNRGSDRVHQPFAHERAFEPSRGAIGPARRLVGEADMTDRPIRRHPIRARQHRGGKIGHGGRMGADIAALVVEELVVKGENTALGVDRGANLMALLPRMIGGDQMLAPVLDPLHRAAEPQRGKADQHVLGIKLAANTEAAADMALEQMHAGGIASQHAGDVVAIPVRHLGGAMKLQHVAGGVIARDRATGFERNAGMAPDREIELDHGMRVAKRGARCPRRIFPRSPVRSSGRLRIPRAPRWHRG